MQAVLVLFFITLSAKAEQKLETLTPSNRFSTARVYSELPDPEGVRRQVLVVDTRIPGPARVEIDLDAPLHFQWYQNERSRVVQTSFPYFATRILTLPANAGLSPEEKERLLAGTFYFSIGDLSPANVISHTFNTDLPSGGHKPILRLPWDAYNPKGTWGFSIEQALEFATNTFLLDAPPGDIVDFCPKFATLDRPHKVHFWQALVTHISELESSYIPYCASDEGKYNPEAKGVISSGLVQISLLSIKNACYQSRGCNLISTQEDLYDPDKNLKCGLGVMSCLASRGCISCKDDAGKWTGIAAYWSTLRTPYEVPCNSCATGKVRVGFKPEIQQSLKTSAPYCF
ncbi:MAG TPA: hypothetical protein VIH99_04245 [Bdellovibrionota bacterium]